MVQFQILDVYTQDFKIEYEDEFEKKGTFDFNDNLSDSGSVEYVKKKPFNPLTDTSFKYEMIIHLFGMTQDGRSLRVSVNGFEPFFYVELPSERAFDTFKILLKNSLQKKRNTTLYDSIKFELVKKEKLYGYTNNKQFPFVKLSIKSKREFYTLKKCFLNDKNEHIFKINGEPVKVYEANLDPMLRFFHLQNLNPCGWAEIEDEWSQNIDINWLDIKPVQIPLGVAPFCCAFWDIECYSSSGDFPVTKKNWSKIGDQLYEVCQTSDICIDTLCRAILNPKSPPKGVDGIYLKGKIPSFEKLKIVVEPINSKLSNIFEKKSNYTGSDIAALLKNLKLSLDGDPIIQIGLVLTKGSAVVEKYVFVFGSCSLIDGVVVKSYGSEKEMILGFVNFCHEKNPDMLIGYNVFGFDE
jgi:DNA polymerase elongation subunit (family B)